MLRGQSLDESAWPLAVLASRTIRGSFLRRALASCLVPLVWIIHTDDVHHDPGKAIGLEGCCASGGKDADLNPIDLVAMGVVSCLMIVMAKNAKGKRRRYSPTVPQGTFRPTEGAAGSTGQISSSGIRPG